MEVRYTQVVSARERVSKRDLDRSQASRRAAALLGQRAEDACMPGERLAAKSWGDQITNVSHQRRKRFAAIGSRFTPPLGAAVADDADEQALRTLIPAAAHHQWLGEREGDRDRFDPGNAHPCAVPDSMLPFARLIAVRPGQGSSERANDGLDRTLEGRPRQGEEPIGSQVTARESWGLPKPRAARSR